MAANNGKLIGLDISDTAVKLVEFSGVARKGGGIPDKLKIEHYAVASLPSGSVSEKNVVEPEAVGEAIAKVVRKAGTRTRRAAVAVGGSSTITKYINMPKGLTERQLEQQVEVEAEQHIPFPVEEVSLDFQVLDQQPKDSDVVNVLLAAARTEIVDAKVAALEFGGIEAGVVDLEVFALENACSLLGHQLLRQSGDKPEKKSRGKSEPVMPHQVAVMDVGSSTTSLTVLENGRPVYTRDQQFGGQALTEEIMERYGLTYEQAGLAKKTGELPEEGADYANEVLKPFMREMAHQVNRSIQLFQSAKSSALQMQQIILAGGCAAIKDIDRVVQAETGIPTVIADPFGKIAVAPKAMPQRLVGDAPSLLIAAGLAMRAFD